MSDKVTLGIDDRGVASITLSNPAGANAMDLEFTAALRAHAERLQDESPTVVVLRAEGERFCVGGDLGWMQAQPDAQASLRELAGDLHAALLLLDALDAPVIARVQGAAAGAGMSLVCGADLAIAGRSATFTVAYTGVGLSPDGGSSYWLPRIIGRRRAAELMLTNRRVKAEEALTIGLVSQVVDDAELDAAVEALAGRLAAGPTPAYGSVKRLLHASVTNDYETQLALEADTIAARAGSASGREGISAFLEKRAPSYR